MNTYNVYVNGNLVGTIAAVNDHSADIDARMMYCLHDYDMVVVTAIGPRRSAF